MFDGSDTAGVPTEVFFVFAVALGVGCYAPPLVGAPASAVVLGKASGPLQLQTAPSNSNLLSNGSVLDHDLDVAQLPPPVQRLKRAVCREEMSDSLTDP